MKSKLPQGLTQRYARKSDYPFFRDLISTSLRPYVEQFGPFNFKYLKNSFDQTYKKILILQKGKKRIGVYQLTPKGKKLDVQRIFLRPSYQNKGLGTALMKNFEELGYKHMTLEVWENNPARKLYKKLGYKQVSKKRYKLAMEKVL